MKMVLVIADGVEQFVLTPETETEKLILDLLCDGSGKVASILKGQFYECAGGWLREGLGQDSTIIRLLSVSQENREIVMGDPVRGKVEFPNIPSGFKRG